MNECKCNVKLAYRDISKYFSNNMLYRMKKSLNNTNNSTQINLRLILIHRNKRKCCVFFLILTILMIISVSSIFTQWCCTTVRYDVRTAVCVRTPTKSMTACGARQQNPASIKTCAARNFCNVLPQGSLTWGSWQIFSYSFLFYSHTSNIWIIYNS